MPLNRTLRRIFRADVRHGALLLLFALLLTGCSGKEPAASPDEAKDAASAAGGSPAAGAAADADSAPAVEVTLALNWFPEPEHGGFYAAQVRGFYRQAGLDVTIQPGGASVVHMLEQVAAGRATFGVANADNILFARAERVPVVALLAPMQNSPRCVMVHAATGIDSFDKLRDVTLAMTPGAAFADFLRWKLPLPGVRIVRYTGSVEPFLVNPRYAQQGYIFSEPFLARQQGADPGVLMVSELGFNPYTSLLFTTEKTIANRPDLVRRMVAASAQGWQDYLADPEPTNRQIHELNPVVDMESLAYGAKEIAPLVATAEAREQGLGTMSLERWQALNEQLVESGQLSAGAVDAKQAFTAEFLPALPPAGNSSARIQ